MTTPNEQKRIRRLDRLAILMDDSIRIPVVGYRIGYDVLLGLIPGIGDIAGLAIGTYVVLESARFKVPRSTLLRMIANVALDTIFGAIPIVGDVFDATYKANLRNLRLLREHTDSRADAARSDKRFLGLLVGIPIVVVLAILALLIWLITTFI